MPKQSLENRHACLYRCIQKNCQDCTSSRPCPSLIVIAMRYSQEMNKVSGK